MDNTARIEALEATGIASKNSFAASLIAQYHQKGYLSEKQWYWVDKLASDNSGIPVQERKDDNSIEEIFDGKKIQQLLHTASSKLLRPKLRFPTDKHGKIIFSFVADTESKWFNCTFIDNGAQENKKRYGFISNTGQGRLHRESPVEIKAAIRKIAQDPVAEGKITGQKYSFCCFCGLGLINKSSVHHGYGPICADKYSLPWGDTGDVKDEEAAASAELAHIQLEELE